MAISARIKFNPPADNAGVNRRWARVVLGGVVVAEASFPADAADGVVGPFEATEGDAVEVWRTDTDAAGNESARTVLRLTVPDVTPPPPPEAEEVTLETAPAAA